MMIIVVAIPFNLFLNYVFIFGNFGFPQLGGVGAGYTTAITYWIIFFVSIYFTFKIKKIRPYGLFRSWPKPLLPTWKSQLAIGVPIGLSIFFEASIFSIVTLFMGTMFSTVIIAAHQAAINFSSLLFMVPLSISLALTIFVAYEIGVHGVSIK